MPPHQKGTSKKANVFHNKKTHPGPKRRFIRKSTKNHIAHNHAAHNTKKKHAPKRVIRYVAKPYSRELQLEIMRLIHDKLSSSEINNIVKGVIAEHLNKAKTTFVDMRMILKEIHEMMEKDKANDEHWYSTIETVRNICKEITTKENIHLYTDKVSHGIHVGTSEFRRTVYKVKNSFLRGLPSHIKKYHQYVISRLPPRPPREPHAVKDPASLEPGEPRSGGETGIGPDERGAMPTPAMYAYQYAYGGARGRY